jgi:hypothetical protein
MDQGGRVVQEAISFAERKTDEPNPVVLEIAQASMDQTGCLPARPAREVSALQKAGTESSPRSLTGDPRPDDAPSDDEEVRRPLQQSDEVRGTGPSRKFLRQDHPAGRKAGARLHAGLATVSRAKDVVHFSERPKH